MGFPVKSPKDNERRQGSYLTYQAAALQYSGLERQQKPAGMLVCEHLCVCDWGHLVTEGQQKQLEGDRALPGEKHCGCVGER